MVSTYLGYRGIVQFKLRIGDKVICVARKNNGTDYLLKSFCKFLSGNYGGNADIPQLFDLRKRVSEDPEKWETCLNQEIVLTGKTYFKTSDSQLGIDNSWVARFTASIPYSTLVEAISDTDTTPYRFYLYGSYDTNDISERYHDLAYIPVTAEALSRITEGTQALVEWTMQILNSDEVGE